MFIMCSFWGSINSQINFRGKNFFVLFEWKTSIKLCRRQALCSQHPFLDQETVTRCTHVSLGVHLYLRGVSDSKCEALPA